MASLSLVPCCSGLMAEWSRLTGAGEEESCRVVKDIRRQGGRAGAPSKLDERENETLALHTRPYGSKYRNWDSVEWEAREMAQQQSLKQPSEGGTFTCENRDLGIP